MPNVVQIVNQHYACARCHATGCWRRTTRPQYRDNSSIHHLHCTQCNARIVAKVDAAHQPRASAQGELRREYDTLQALVPAFADAGPLGVLEPLAFIQAADTAIMLTQEVAGIDLVRHARTLHTSGLDAAFRRAGQWLRRLHDAGCEPGPARTLGTAEKLDDLERTYGHLLRTPGVRAAHALLVHTAAKLERLPLRAVRLHGDCKPENMLCNAARCVGLDIHWQITAAPVYDLAPFLDHLWLARLGGCGARARARHHTAESAFLTGYGAGGDPSALCWAQLYFALTYLARFRQRGTAAAYYASWKLWPLVRQTTAQLHAATATAVAPCPRP